MFLLCALGALDSVCPETVLPRQQLLEEALSFLSLSVLVSQKKKENLNLDLGLSLGRTWVQDTSRHGFKSWLHYFLAMWAL